MTVFLVDSGRRCYSLGAKVADFTGVPVACLFVAEFKNFDDAAGLH